MTREEKILKRKERKYRRCNKRRLANKEKHSDLKRLMDRHGISRFQARQELRYGQWPDSESETGYSQVCSWDAVGICSSPCNGDC